MNKFTLTLLDTTGIQEYIFSSNRLQENIGASELVYRATTLWAFEALDKVGLSCNIDVVRDPKDPGKELDWGYKPNVTIEDVDAEVIQAAGGNTFIIFRESDDKHTNAIKFTRELILQLLKEAPGLTVLAQHVEFDLDKDLITDKRKELLRNMQAHKLSRLPSSPTLGLSVTAECESTGLPAVRTAQGEQTLHKRKFNLLIGEQETNPTEINRLISRETTFKLAARDLAQERLRYVIGKEAIKKKFMIENKEVEVEFEFPSDIDKLGRVSGEESYVAVIHADGNRMGKHVDNVAKNVEAKVGKENVKAYNREYIEAMRSFSRYLEAASREALREIVKKIVSAIDMNDMVAGIIPLSTDKEKNENDQNNGSTANDKKKPKRKYLPFRPLVFGGDDVTFLCNGQLGLELATEYLKAFEKHTGNQSLKGFHASAGIPIVKMHYPFSRAYTLSEELTKSAKSLTRANDCSALDWHFAQSGLSGSLKMIRDREFKSEDGHPLHLRPLTLKNGTKSWANLEEVVKKFQDEENWSHNKVLGLREPLRKSPKSVEDYRLNFDLDPLPPIAGDEAQKTGWTDSTCWYFDAIELLDHHVSLK